MKKPHCGGEEVGRGHQGELGVPASSTHGLGLRAREPGGLDSSPIWGVWPEARVPGFSFAACRSPLSPGRSIPVGEVRMSRGETMLGRRWEDTGDGWGEIELRNGRKGEC